MKTPITRRGKEYFEALDELYYQEDFVPYELWIYLPHDEQVKKSRMTNDLIKDKLHEKGYSKGSSNEQKKYRLIWLKERNLDAEIETSSGNTIKIDSFSQAFEAFRKNIEEKVRSDMQDELNQARQRTKETQEELELTNRKLNQANQDAHDLRAVSNKQSQEVESIHQQLKKAEESKVVAEANVSTLEKMHHDYKKNAEEQRKETLTSMNQMIDHQKQQIASLKESHKTEIDKLMTTQEAERHQLIAKISQLNIELKKLQQQFNKTESLAQKTKIDFDYLNQQYKKTEVELNGTRKENQQLRNQMLEKEKMLSKLDAENRAAQHKNDEQSRAAEKQQKEFMQEKQKTARLEEQIKQHKAELERKEMEIKRAKK